MKNVIKITDEFNPIKSVEFKQSKCSHFYYRQLINNKPITNWNRAKKNHVNSIINNFYKGTLISDRCYRIDIPLNTQTNEDKL